jgi:hypothetical protein
VDSREPRAMFGAESLQKRSPLADRHLSDHVGAPFT